MTTGIKILKLKHNFFSIFLVLILLNLFFSSKLKSECLPIICTADEITKMAKGGLTATEIKKFCSNFGQKKNEEGLREKYSILEDKNWKTHYLFQNEREIVFFTVSKDVIKLQSNNPRVQYFGMEDLGDAIRFKRKEIPYKAIYTVTISREYIGEKTILVSQQYKKVRQFTWEVE